MKTRDCNGDINSFLLINKFGINTKLDLIHSIYNTWDCKVIKHAGIIDAWLLNWKPEYFATQFDIKNHSIIINGQQFECKLPLGYNLETVKKVCLSFRICQQLDIAVCLIKFIY